MPVSFPDAGRPHAAPALRWPAAHRGPGLPLHPAPRRVHSTRRRGVPKVRRGPPRRILGRRSCAALRTAEAPREAAQTRRPTSRVGAVRHAVVVVSLGGNSSVRADAARSRVRGGVAAPGFPLRPGAGPARVHHATRPGRAGLDGRGQSDISIARRIRRGHKAVSVLHSSSFGAAGPFRRRPQSALKRGIIRPGDPDGGVIGIPLALPLHPRGPGGESPEESWSARRRHGAEDGPGDYFENSASSAASLAIFSSRATRVAVS